MADKLLTVTNPMTGESVPVGYDDLDGGTTYAQKVTIAAGGVTIASGGVAAGGVAAGAVVSGAVLSGALATGAITDLPAKGQALMAGRPEGAAVQKETGRHYVKFLAPLARQRQAARHIGALHIAKGHHHAHKTV